MERRAGFTLIEILVVLSLLAVLMGLSAGLIQRAGQGNMLLQTAQSLASQLASARAQSYGNDRAYVSVEPRVVRTYRNRQVFHWPCEDFVKTTDGYELQHAGGGVEISEPREAGREGRFAIFSGGRVDLGDPPWLDFVDGFSIRCRIRPGAPTGLGIQTLFKKGPGLVVSLRPHEAGRFGIEAKIRLRPKPGSATTGGDYVLVTGDREGETLPEWRSPLLAGRWYELRITYDRNTFTIHVDERLRAIRSDKNNRMWPNDDRFVIGSGFLGGFDSLVLSGIFEDDDDRYDIPEAVSWIDDQGKPKEGATYIRFKNRSLDPRYHAEPIWLWFRLDQGEEGGGARRVVTVSLSGETFIKLPSE
ncbi:MAG: prepilin-type N-terminal cleavage/methylation domain-containing protein [Planctomycetota bacterium]